MTHTENFLDTQYQYAWVSEAHEIHWKELEIFNRISDIDMEGTAYGNIRHTFDKVIGKYYYVFVGTLVNLRGMPFYLLPPNGVSIFGYQINLTESSLELVKLEAKGLKVCNFGSTTEICSKSREVNQLGHVKVQVRAIPFNKRNNGKTVSVSKYIDK